MTRKTRNLSHAPTSAAFFARLLLIIFSMELAAMMLFPDPSSSLHPLAASVANGLLVVTLCAPLVWFGIVRPLAAGKESLGPASCGPSWNLFFKVLIVIVLIEFLVNLTIVYLMPDANGISSYFADACLTTFLCAPLLWWIMSREQRCQIDSLSDLLGTPLKLYLLLLGAIFVVDLVEMPFISMLNPFVNVVGYKLVDAFLTTLIVSPIFWWLVLRPLRKSAFLEKHRSDALQAQVVEAIVTIDEQGLIDSFNPAAESIFGYSSAEITGNPVSALFCESDGSLAELIRTIPAMENGSSIRGIQEFPCRRKDGSNLTMDVSISRIMLEGEKQYLIIMRDITERKQVEEALRESEERFNIAISGTNEGIWDWNIETGTIYYNPRLKEMLGYTPEEFPNVIGTFEALLHPEDHDRMAEAVLRHLKERTIYDMECRVRTREHGYRWFRTRGKAVWDESGRAVRMAGFISDISDRKKAEEALRQSSERFRQLYEQSEDAIMFFKPGTSYIIDVNDTAEKLFGYTKKELKEGGVELLCRPENLDNLKGAISGISNSGTSYLDNIVNLRKDGTEINVSMRGKLVTIQRVAICYCTFRNITDRVRTEEKVREIQSRLIQVNKMTSLGLLVSSVAHEINNPNNFIMANSQLLARMWEDALKILQEYHQENDGFLIGGIPFPEMEEHSPQLFEGIIEGSRRINDIINNLKSFARHDRRVMDRDVDVNQVASSAVTMLQHEIVKFTNSFKLEPGDSIPGIRGSSQQLSQVIINLLMNACQSLLSREAGIWLTTRFDPASGHVIIAVRDEGCGMIRENSNRIMEPFFTTKLDSGGTGLGLSICQSIVKEHGWTLDFVSSPGKGSTFFVKIPVEGVEIKEKMQSVTPPPGA